MTKLNEAVRDTEMIIEDLTRDNRYLRTLHNLNVENKDVIINYIFELKEYLDDNMIDYSDSMFAYKNISVTECEEMQKDDFR